MYGANLSVKVYQCHHLLFFNYSKLYRNHILVQTALAFKLNTVSLANFLQNR